MHACTPLVGVELEKSAMSYAVPASGEGEPGFVFLCVFVCLCGEYCRVCLGKLCCDVEEKAAVPGTGVAPLERLKSGCLPSGAPKLLYNLSQMAGALHPASL